MIVGHLAKINLVFLLCKNNSTFSVQYNPVATFLYTVPNYRANQNETPFQPYQPPLLLAFQKNIII